MKSFPGSEFSVKWEQKERGGQTHEGKPGKDGVEGLIDELDVYPELAREAVGRSVDVV